MNKEEYKQYLDKVKSNLTEKERISLAKEYNKLPKSASYWLKRMNNYYGYDEESYMLLKYSERRYNYIVYRMEDLEYILDIPEQYTYKYKLFHS